MTNTTYYDLNIVEGTDIVNPLIVDNPNYEKIDEVMHNNAVSGVTLATEIANATVHAITRENSECSVIRFIATSVWKAGDSVTVDGVPVTALLPSGETLPDGAYVINANVLCILTGTNLTVYAERKKTNDASDIAYNGTNVSAELNKLNSNLDKCGTELTQIARSTQAATWESFNVDLSQYRFLYFEIVGGTGFGFEPSLIPVSAAILHNSPASAYNFKYNDVTYGFCAKENAVCVYSETLTYISAVFGVK